MKALLPLTLAALMAGCIQPSPNNGLLAGFARTDITPVITDTWSDVDGDAVYEPEAGDTFEDVNANGVFDAVWMAGLMEGHPATSIHDSLYATALVLDDGRVRLAVASVDLIGLFRPDVQDIRNALPDDLGVDLLIVTATHNHEGPDTMGLWGPSPGLSGVDPAYIARVKADVVRAVADAVANLQPVTMLAYDTVGGDEALVSDGRPPFVFDNGIRALRFVSDDGETIGTLLSWAVHPETLWKPNAAITSDYVGYFRDGVTEGVRRTDQLVREGIGGTALFVNGAIGGMMTIDTDSAIIDPVDGVLHVEPSHEKARAVGHTLADLLLDRLAAPADLEADSPEIRTFSEEIEVPVENQGYLTLLELGVLNRPVGPRQTITSEIHLITIGDVWIATVPGEIFPELVNGGVESPDGGDYPGGPFEDPPIRDLMHGGVNFVFGLANDELGYILPRTQWDVQPPYTYGRTTAPYEETNATGVEVAGIVHRAIADLAARASAPPDDPRGNE